MRAKFEQHEDLRRILLGTGNSLLAEAAPNDLKWGIGLACDDPERTDVRRWRGQNLLGRILMEVRDEMRILEQNGRIGFVDMSWTDFPEWLMTAGELVRIPKYHNSIRAYADSLRGDHERNCFYYYGPIKEWDIAMRINMGGGLPIIGFYEMKQDIYDLSRL